MLLKLLGIFPLMFPDCGDVPNSCFSIRIFFCQFEVLPANLKFPQISKKELQEGDNFQQSAQKFYPTVFLSNKPVVIDCLRPISCNGE